MSRADELAAEVERAHRSGGPGAALGAVVRALGADSGTLHVLGADGALHLAAGGEGMPEPVHAAIRRIPVGKGMAGLAVERAAPVTTCNLQSDTTGDVRPGARATGLEGAICVPLLSGTRPVGALGVGCRAPRDFTAEETDLLLAAGRVLAEAVAGPDSRFPDSRGIAGNP